MITRIEAHNITNFANKLSADWLIKCLEEIEKLIREDSAKGKNRTLWNRIVYIKDINGNQFSLSLPDEETKILINNLSKDFGFSVKIKEYNFLEISWE